MDVIIKISAVAVVAAILAVAVRKTVPEMSLTVIVCAVIVVFSLGLGIVPIIANSLNSMADRAGFSVVYFDPLFKIVAISVISKISSDICRDSGSSALATCVEFAGCVLAVVLAVPLIESVVDLIMSV